MYTLRTLLYRLHKGSPVLTCRVTQSNGNADVQDLSFTVNSDDLQGVPLPLRSVYIHIHRQQYDLHRQPRLREGVSFSPVEQNGRKGVLFLYTSSRLVQQVGHAVAEFMDL
jgi:hypothetical protein